MPRGIAAENCGYAFFVRLRACFHCGVFRWSEKRNFENQKTTCKVSQHCFSLQKNLLWYISVSSFVGYLKGRSSLMIYEKYPELKYKYRNREFWCRGYYVDTVGKNAKKIEEYIKHQLDEDKAGEQLTMGNFWVSWARLRAASNKPMQVSDRTNATWRVASNRGLRPSKKNPRLRRGIIIV